MYVLILPHFDVDFQMPLLRKDNQLGSVVILLTVEVQCITLTYHPRNLSFIICNVNGLSYINLEVKKTCCFRETTVTLLFSE